MSEPCHWTEGENQLSWNGICQLNKRKKAKFEKMYMFSQVIHKCQTYTSNRFDILKEEEEGNPADRDKVDIEKGAQESGEPWRAPSDDGSRAETPRVSAKGCRLKRGKAQPIQESERRGERTAKAADLVQPMDSWVTRHKGMTCRSSWSQRMGTRRK